MTKRGISPLIATVLLVAFAVALGSVVYTYFIVVLPEGSVNPQSCSRYVALEISYDTRGNPQIDRSVQGFSFNLFNAGASRVSAVTYSVEGVRDVYSVEEARIDISSATSRRLTIEYDASIYGEARTIIVTPHYIRSGVQEICTEGRVSITI